MSIAKRSKIDNNNPLTFVVDPNQPLTVHRDVPESEDLDLITEAKPQILAKFGVDIDITNDQTVAQVGVSIILTKYLKVFPSQHITVEGREVLAGGLTLKLRKLAIQVPGSALNDTLVKGVFRHMELWDVISMYPAAIQLQPMPNEFTQLVEITEMSQLDTHEGLVLVKFQWPETEQYVSLPAKFQVTKTIETAKKTNKIEEEKTCFPLQGQSVLTIHEVRRAMLRGCQIELLDGVGFIPTANETNHALVEFCKQLMLLKKDAPKPSAERDLWKGIMNKGFGKMNQHKNGLGDLYIPEWYALMVGRARSIEGDLMAACKAVGGYTDSLFSMVGASFKCQSLVDLESVKSGLEREVEDATFWTSGKPGNYAFISQDCTKILKGGKYSGNHNQEENESSENENRRHRQQILASLKAGELTGALLTKTCGYTPFRSNGGANVGMHNLFTRNYRLSPFKSTDACQRSIVTKVNNDLRGGYAKEETLEQMVRRMVESGSGLDQILGFIKYSEGRIRRAYNKIKKEMK